MEPESEEDDSNPYPLDGKYVNEADRTRWEYDENLAKNYV